MIKQAPGAVEQPFEWAVGDDSSLVASTEVDVVGGHRKPGVILHACPMTNDGRAMLGLKLVGW